MANPCKSKIPSDSVATLGTCSRTPDCCRIGPSKRTSVSCRCCSDGRPNDERAGYTPIESLRNAHVDLVQLDPQRFRARYPIELSGGQRQRVAFARALAADPGIVLLDEPFGALDAITRHELQRQFLGLKQRLNKTMVMVTHDVDEALQLGDRIAVLKAGRLLQTGTPSDLLDAPAHDYIAQLLRHRSHGDHS